MLILIFVRFLWLLSLFGFLAVLLLVHAYLPSHVVFTFEGTPLSGFAFTKDTFFYLSFGTAIFLNAALLAFGNIYSYVHKSYIFIPKRNYWLQDVEHHRRAAKMFKQWMKGVLFCINLLNIYFAISVYSLHDNFANFNTAWIFVLIAVLLVGWLGYYFVLYNQTQEPE